MQGLEFGDAETWRKVFTPTKHPEPSSKKLLGEFPKFRGTFGGVPHFSDYEVLGLYLGLPV